MSMGEDARRAVAATIQKHTESAKQADEKAVELEKEARDLRRKAEQWRALAADIQSHMMG